MTESTIFPHLGELLRSLVTRAGYRGHIKESALDKDLDDLANELRPGSSCDLMKKIEDACRSELTVECGTEWAQFLDKAWSRSREDIQQLVLTVDASPLPYEQGRDAVLRLFEIPLLSDFMLRATKLFQGPELNSWWKSPLGAWFQYAASKAKVTEKDLKNNLANHLDVDQRTVDRWIAGEAIKKLCWPYRKKIRAAIGKKAERQIGKKEVENLTGWLVVAVTVQSLPTDLRDKIRLDYGRSQQPWSLNEVVSDFRQLEFDHGNRPIRALSVPLLQTIEHLFAGKPRDAAAIQHYLEEFQSLIRQEDAFCQRSYQHIHDWFAARLAASNGQESDALLLYEAAVNGVWWRGGPNQHPFIRGALLYAIGVGKKVAAERYWDKIYLLGLNKWPKPPLDDQEQRRLAFGFEKTFAPQKAKVRVPPFMEFIVRENGFSVSPQQLADPNRKVKFAEGRTRRTPLMDAIREGTLEDVRLLIQAGGDPNDYIKESGEGPLSYALRRACDRKDPAIVEYLLTLPLTGETVNRPASTQRQTPLELAISMASANVVDGLIKSGAKIEAPCNLSPSALCFAMNLLYGSIYPDDPTQLAAYLNGKDGVDANDAKNFGAVLDSEISMHRQAMFKYLCSSPRKQEIFSGVWKYFARPVADRREVIRVLLRHRADANRRYKIEPQEPAEWTPTLFAAQVGDLDTFKILIESGGDPSFTLSPPTLLQNYDALWVATAYERTAIMNHLLSTANAVIPGGGSANKFS